MWKKIWTLITGVAKYLFRIFMDGVSDTVSNILNDKMAQQAAKDAINAVAKQGLKDNEALESAVNILKERGIANGIESANTVLKTLVQTAYCALKCSNSLQVTK